jgi:DNA-binding LytR/AlgR family response regulator
MQLTLREWRQHMLRPVTLVALAAISLVLAIMAPFGTGAFMRFLPGLGYWSVTVLFCYAWGTLVDCALRNWRGAPLAWMWVAVSGVTTAFGVTVIVTVLNALALDFVPALGDLPAFIGTVMAIAMIIAVALNLIARQNVQSSATQDGHAALPPALLDRLPFDKRGPLVALSVEDHYVRVHTTKGEELILLRLSDAVREVGETQGAQVHRSHWAAFEQVKAVRREGDRAILTMTGDIEIPVSRANMPKIKEAGLLPRNT